MQLPNSRTTISMIAMVALSGISAVHAEERPFPGEKQQRKWVGDSTIYKAKGGGTIIAVPPQVAAGKPWVWRARFWGHASGFDRAMIERGYHIVYCDVSNLFGAPAAVERWDKFYDYLRTEHGFAEKAVLEGMSRGGLIVYNWAAANPEKVAAIYGDAPVLDFKSWPGHDHRGIFRAYGFNSAEEAKAYKGNPIDNLEPLARAGIPIIHVVGDKDEVVPVSENTAIAEKRYKEMSGVFEVIHKQDAGHQHGLGDPTPIVDFVLKHTAATAGNNSIDGSPSADRDCFPFIPGGSALSPAPLASWP